MASTAHTRLGEDMIAAPLPDALTTTGAGAITTPIIEVNVLVLSGRRRRRKREVEIGVVIEVGAGVVREDAAATANHPIAAKEKEEERGEGSEVGPNRV